MDVGDVGQLQHFRHWNRSRGGKIAYLEMRDHEEPQRMIAMGVLLGMSIVLVQVYPSYVFEIDQTRYAVDKEIAECIQVRIGG